MSKEDLKKESEDVEVEETKEEEKESEDTSAEANIAEDEDQVSPEDNDDDTSPIEVDDDEEEDDDEDEDVEDNKKSPNVVLWIILVVLIGTIIFLINQKVDTSDVTDLDQAASTLGSFETYTNPVHGFSVEYPEGFEIIATDSMPDSLKAEGIETMEDMNLSNGDVLFAEVVEANSDNIIYTLLALSEQQGFTSLSEYLEGLRVNLADTGVQLGFEYKEVELTVGDQEIPANQFSFEMPVPSGEDVRIGAFYDTIFEHEGTSYSISFGYPTDVESGDEYLSVYENMLKTINFEDMVVEEGTAS